MQLRDAFFRVAKEKMTPWTRCVFEDMPHEVWTVNPIAQSGAKPVERPHHRHTVRQHQIELFHNLSEFRIMPRFRNDVCIGGANCARLRCMCQFLRLFQRGVVRHTSHTETHQIDCFHRHRKTETFHFQLFSFKLYFAERFTL
jgi:hypothetical protein